MHVYGIFGRAIIWVWYSGYSCSECQARYFVVTTYLLLTLHILCYRNVRAAWTRGQGKTSHSKNCRYS